LESPLPEGLDPLVVEVTARN